MAPAARTEPVIERETAQFDSLPAVVSQLNPIRCIALDVSDTIVGRNLRNDQLRASRVRRQQAVTASKVLNHCMERYAVRGLDGRWESNFGTVRCTGLSHTTINLVFSAPCIAFKSWSFFRCWLSACLLVLTDQPEREAHAVDGPMLRVLEPFRMGAPHIGCNRPCCRNLFLRPATGRNRNAWGDRHQRGSERVGAMFEEPRLSICQAFQSAQTSRSTGCPCF